MINVLSVVYVTKMFFHIKWMFVHKGEPKRCYCGHWFKIVERTWPDLTDFGMTPDMLKPQAH